MTLILGGDCLSYYMERHHSLVRSRETWCQGFNMKLVLYCLLKSLSTDFDESYYVCQLGLFYLIILKIIIPVTSHYQIKQYNSLVP